MPALRTAIRNVQMRWHYLIAYVFIRLRCHEAAADAYQKALSLQPYDRQSRFQRAWCLLKVPNRRPHGIIEFQQLVAEEPFASGYYLMACALQQESRHDEAVQAFREALKLERYEAGDFYHNYAVSLEALGHFEEAADAYRNAAQLNPADADAWSNLGAMLAGLGRWKDAAPCQERAMRLVRSVPHAVSLAWTLYELNRLDEADRAVRDALVLHPQSVEAKECLAIILAGQDRYQEAIQTAHDACELNSNAVSSRIALASVLTEAGRLDDALGLARAVAESAPDEPRAYSTLGAVFLRMRNGASALASFDRMAECLAPEAKRLPVWPWTWCLAGRGAALSLLGRHEEAAAVSEQVLNADSGFFERWPEVAAYYRPSFERAGRQSESRRS